MSLWISFWLFLYSFNTKFDEFTYFSMKWNKNKPLVSEWMKYSLKMDNTGTGT